MLKIGIVGSNNTGKTTLAYKLAAILKEKKYRADVVAHESVRSCPLGTKEKTTIEASCGFLLPK